MTHSSQNRQQNPGKMPKILPYQLEPEFSSGEEDNEEVFSESEEEENDFSARSSNESRLVDTSWCSCERCVVMPKEIECICCKELVFLSKVVEGEPINVTRI